MNRRIAIIGGAGKMGIWLAGFLLNEGHRVVIADVNQGRLNRAGRELGVKIAADNISAVSNAELVILSVPIEGFEAAVAALGPHVKAGQAVIDITSTKAAPVAVMHRHIKAGTVLGAHPLFGPGAGSIANKNIVLTPTDAKEKTLARRVKRYLEERGGRVSVMTPEEHDATMSLVLGLSHFIALVAADTLLGSGNLHPMEAAGSSTYKVLLTLIESVLSEDPELYASIQMSLPHVTEYEKLFRARTAEWADLVAAGDRAEFARRMRSLKNQLEKVAPDFVKSYENLYRIVEGF